MKEIYEALAEEQAYEDVILVNGHYTNISKEFTNKQIKLLKEAFEESDEWAPLQLEFLVSLVRD